MNYRHLYSCDTIGYWMYPEDFKNHCTGVLGDIFKQVHYKQRASCAYLFLKARILMAFNNFKFIKNKC